jgi:hypothetical protein
MKIPLALVSLGSLALFACGSSTEAPPVGATGKVVEAFNPPPPADGYTRIVAPVIKGLEPGADRMYCQYVLAPFDHDVDVIDTGGYQSRYGHHVIAYATTKSAPLGTSRPCAGDDNLAGGFLGGAGGEAGGSAIGLPPGVAFRLPKGSSIMLNTHFMNLGAEAVDGQSVIDFKFADGDGSRTIAAMFVNITLGFSVEPLSKGTADATCTVPRDLNFLLFSNHMHNIGKSVFTDVTPPGGSSRMFREDTTWSYEMQFNPVFNKWDMAQPFLVKQGEAVHTHCEWDNTTDKAVKFPDEMCVGIGFFLSDKATSPTCLDGKWREAP